MQNVKIKHDSKNPTRQSVLRAMNEFHRLGSESFLDKYTNGHPPENMFLLHDGNFYPLKAIFAASFTPPIKSSVFNSNQAGYRLRDLGFSGAVRRERNGDVVSIFSGGIREREVEGTAEKAAREEIEADIVQEGERLVKEIALIKRNASIVAKAKMRRGYDCEACGFNFGETYGTLGQGFIEAHHIEPLSTRKEPKETSVDDFAMLCANCHRMMHRRNAPLSILALKKYLIKQRGPQK